MTRDIVDVEDASGAELEATIEYTAMMSAIRDLRELLHSIHDEAWRSDTRRPPMDFLVLVMHVAGSFRFVQSWFRADIIRPPMLDRASMWRAFPESTSDVVVETALATTQGATPSSAKAELAAAVAAFLAVSAHVGPAQVVGCPMFGETFTLTALDVIANRVLEVSVHLLDVQHAIGISEELPEGSGPVLRSILDPLLGAPSIEVFSDDLRYVLVGTGRAPLTTDEKSALGQLSLSWPLLQ